MVISARVEWLAPLVLRTKSLTSLPESFLGFPGLFFGINCVFSSCHLSMMRRISRCLSGNFCRFGFSLPHSNNAETFIGCQSMFLCNFSRILKLGGECGSGLLKRKLAVMTQKLKEAGNVFRRVLYLVFATLSTRRSKKFAAHLHAWTRRLDSFTHSAQSIKR